MLRMLSPAFRVGRMDSTMFIILASTLSCSFLSAKALVVTGVAHSSGYLVNCPITLAPGVAPSAGKIQTVTGVTTSTGSFSLTVKPATAELADLKGAYLTISNGSSCKDTGTGLPLPISLGALVDIPASTPANGPVTLVVNGITTLAYITKKNLGSPEISRIAGIIQGGTAFTATQFYNTFQGVLGTTNGAQALYTDLVAATKNNIKDAAKVQAFNLELVVSLSLGSALANGFDSKVTKETAAETIVIKFYGAAYDAYLSLHGSSVGLTDVSFLNKIVTKSIPGIQADVASAGSSILSQVNTYLANLGTSANSLALLTNYAGVMYVAGATLGNAAANLGAGKLTPASATSLYTGTPLTNAFASARPPAKFSNPWETDAGYLRNSNSRPADNNPTEGSTIVQTVIIPAGSSTTLTTTVTRDAATGKPTIISTVKPLGAEAGGSAGVAMTTELVPNDAEMPATATVPELPVEGLSGAASGDLPIGTDALRMLPLALEAAMKAPFAVPIPVNGDGTATAASTAAEATLPVVPSAEPVATAADASLPAGDVIPAVGPSAEQASAALSASFPAVGTKFEAVLVPVVVPGVFSQR